MKEFRTVPVSLTEEELLKKSEESAELNANLEALRDKKKKITSSLGSSIKVAEAELNTIVQEIEKAAETYLDTFGGTKSLLPAEKKMFVEMAKAYKLNPFKREIYCVAYGKDSNRTLNIITGYEVYLKRAFETGLLRGWRVWTEGDKADNIKAIIEIKIKGWHEPFRHEVFYSEYVQKKKDFKTGKTVINSMWASKPRTMLKKVAIGQGFRLAFPSDFAGFPYLQEELPFEKETVKENVLSNNDMPQRASEQNQSKVFTVEADEEPLDGEIINEENEENVEDN